MLTRRSFLLASGAFAFGGAWAGSGSPVRFGILSDTHVRGAGDADEIARALRYFKARGVDAVLHCGDVTNLGYIDALSAFASAKHEVMDGVPIVVSPGNRDFSDTSHMTDETREADRDRLILSDPEGCFREILGTSAGRDVRATKVRDVWIVAAAWGQEGALEEFFLAHPEIVASERPVVVLQHPHPPETVFARETWVGGDAKSTCWLKMFPDFVSFSGHSHLGFGRSDSLWADGFSACAAGSYLLENGLQSGAREVSILEVRKGSALLTRTDLRTGRESVHRLAGAFVRPGVGPLRIRRRGSLRFMQWNVGHFSMGRATTTAIRAEDGAKEAERFLKEIAAAAPDIIGFCEFSDEFDQGGRKTADLLKSAGYELVTGPSNDYQYNALAFKNISHGKPEILNYARREQATYALAVEAEIGGRAVTVVQTHLDVSSGEARTAQAKELLARFGNRDRIVLAGDFNVSGLEEYDPYLNAGFSAANGRTAKSLPTHRRRQAAFTPAIDNVFARGFRASAAEIGDYGLRISDHRPLVCSLSPDDSRVAAPFRPIRTA